MNEDTPRRPDNTVPEPDADEDLTKRRKRPAPAPEKDSGKRELPNREDTFGPPYPDQAKDASYDLVPPRLDRDENGDNDDP